MWVAKLLLSPVKLGFSPKTDRIWPKLAFLLGLAGSFGALLVVVARGLYLARHLFTLLFQFFAVTKEKFFIHSTPIIG